jgi:hypothetical protein
VHEQKVHQGSGLKNYRAWADIIAQIIRLGTLYQSMKSGDDLLLQDR